MIREIEGKFYEVKELTLNDQIKKRTFGKCR